MKKSLIARVKGNNVDATQELSLQVCAIAKQVLHRFHCLVPSYVMKVKI